MREGVFVSLLDATPDSDAAFAYDKRSALVEFGFFLEGALRNAVRASPLGSMTMDNSAGLGGMAFLREMSGTAHFAAGQRVRLLHIHVAPAALAGLLRGDMARAHPELRRFSACREEDFCRQMRLSPQVLTAANELFLALQSGLPGALYLEGKTLELLGLQALGPDRGGAAVALGPGDRKTLYAIRDQLQSECAAPPHLGDLARQYGMGVAKLQSGFKDMFGASVHGYLKEQRLQKARLLFETGDMNVSEVAWSIGYINISHFSAAYKKRFGILPKKHLKSIRMNGTPLAL